MTIHLRPYQAEPANAILQDARAGRGSTFTVMMSRQAGKNETSAWLEKVMLTAAYAAGGIGIKCAPTFRPQLLTSIRRLKAHLRDAGFGPHYHQLEGFQITLGAAAWHFLSASPDSNVVGATASLLLEADEAQDIEADKFDKEFRPMAATTNATTVLYGTAWSEADLLMQTIADNLQRERRDGYRRHFQYDWRQVAEHLPAYRQFVESERERLGASHPLFTTQYELTPLPGSGRLLSPTQLASIRGLHDRQHVPTPGILYVASLDVAGEDADALSARDRDHTVLTIGQVTPAPAAEKHLPPLTHVVDIVDWKGTGHDALYPELARLLKDVWKVKKVAVDATAMGEATALLLSRALGPNRVIAYRFTQQSKSSLGYGLQAAANTARLKMWTADSSPEHTEAFRQLALCRADYQPNRTVRWYVDPSDGHDDYVASIALIVEAAAQLKPAVARGRLPPKR